MATAVTTTTKPDYPFYADIPTAISGQRWLVVVAACAVAFAQLILVPDPSPLVHWIQVILFPLIPLAALAWAAPRGWTAVFRRLRLRDLPLMLGFAILNMVVTTGIAYAVGQITDTVANPAGEAIQTMAAGDRVMMLLSTIPQLIGEEVVTILPLLALLSVLVRRLGWSRRAALLTAWVATAVMFGAMHLPTYDWNIVQCLVIIGSARLILSLAYMVTKNLWVSAGAHIANDWAIFLAPIVLGGVTLLA
ncbi:CPBP family intramembrane metalloprotease [Demequina sp. SYSU T00192]|uniref:CPBP family intramembrane metalloprotease n=1 Tax=Demequina litoralis TaxID=3051660 RepID=A0ABT8G7N4_9MICO|nr:CPBP family intramembrane glutamic endopeptidase [Demequina sp. SYSU T00192]MDN4475135.1 CPBP family intramembrane metalloprotease [Demequina sp. SYSU T00192]